MVPPARLKIPGLPIYFAKAFKGEAGRERAISDKWWVTSMAIGRADIMDVRVRKN
jgi:hypothetical protein